MKIMAISGSLRKGSFNTKLLKLSQRLLPQEIEFQLYLCGELPLYNQDLDGTEKPQAVTSLLEQIKDADALLISSPEYNHSIPGNLKNAIDWASRPAFNSVLKNKPTAIFSASPSPIGGVRAQSHLKLVLSGTLTPLYPAPEMSFPGIPRILDDEGNCEDQATLERLQTFLNGFIDWVKQQTSVSQ
jgi:chromate reductase